MNQASLCPVCLFHDARPESGTSQGMVYCQKKRKVVSPRRECSSYIKANAKNRKRLHDSIYGRQISEE